MEDELFAGTYDAGIVKYHHLKSQKIVEKIRKNPRKSEKIWKNPEKSEKIEKNGGRIVCRDICCWDSQVSPPEIKKKYQKFVKKKFVKIFVKQIHQKIACKWRTNCLPGHMMLG